MAVTSIWPIKGCVDQVINYARNPEKTTGQVHGELAVMHFFRLCNFRRRTYDSVLSRGILTQSIICLLQVYRSSQIIIAGKVFTSPAIKMFLLCIQYLYRSCCAYNLTGFPSNLKLYCKKQLCYFFIIFIHLQGLFDEITPISLFGCFNWFNR